MPNTSAQEDYLKAIFRLGKGTERVSTAALASALGVRKPSVTAMMKRLSAEGLVEYSSGRGVTLSERGRLATMRVVRRHRLLELFLVEGLGLDWSEVHAEAEVLEHHLSERLVTAIDRWLGHPSEDPHGHPIPDAEGNLREHDVVPLRALASGEHARVRELRARDGDRLQRWKELGLVPGAACRMGGKQEMEDVMHIDVGGRRIVTGSEGIEGVFVEPVA